MSLEEPALSEEEIRLGQNRNTLTLDEDTLVYVYSLLRPQPGIHLIASAKEGSFLQTVCNETVKFSSGGAIVVWSNAVKLGNLCVYCRRTIEIWGERYKLNLWKAHLSNPR